MFVMSESLGSYLDIHYNDKELPMGNNSERIVSQFLELSDNPKGNSAYTNFSTMSEEKNFVNEISVSYSQPNLINHSTYQRVCKLATVSGFMRLFYNSLPEFETFESAFNVLNQEYESYFNELRYADFKSFIKKYHGYIKSSKS